MFRRFDKFLNVTLIFIFDFFEQFISIDNLFSNFEIKNCSFVYSLVAVEFEEINLVLLLVWILNWLLIESSNYLCYNWVEPRFNFCSPLQFTILNLLITISFSNFTRTISRHDVVLNKQKNKITFQSMLLSEYYFIGLKFLSLIDVEFAEFKLNKYFSMTC